MAYFTCMVLTIIFLVIKKGDSSDREDKDFLRRLKENELKWHRL